MPQQYRTSRRLGVNKSQYGAAAHQIQQVGIPCQLYLHIGCVKILISQVMKQRINNAKETTMLRKQVEYTGPTQALSVC